MTGRAKPRPMTTSEEKTVIQMFHAGATQKETGKLLGRSSGMISHVWKRNGLARKFIFTPEIDAKILAMDKRGRSYVSMSIELGVSLTTLKRHCRDNLGIKRYKKGEL